MNRIFLLVIMFVASCYTNAQVVRTVELAEGDDLAALLGDERYQIETMIVNGYLNHANISVLNDCSMKGQLRNIDMSGCIVENDAIPVLGFSSGRWYDVKLPQNLKVIEGSAFMFLKAKTIEFPSTLLRIKEEAFSGALLESIIIPEGVEEICAQAFYNCRKAKKIQLPSTLKVIGTYAFAGGGRDVESELIFCDGQLERIEDGAFMNMNTITEVSLPSSVFSMGKGTFALCRNLKKVKLPESLETLKIESFSECCLEEIVWFGNLREIEYTAMGNVMMNCLELPEGLTKINEKAIISEKTERLILPSTLTSFAYNAFSLCTAIKEVYAKSAVPPTLDINGNLAPFPANAVLYVPVGARDAYLSTFCRGEFKEIIETENFPTSVGGVMANDAMYSAYGEKGAIGIINNGTVPVAYCVYTADGKLCNKGVAARGASAVNADKGIYIVKIGKNVDRVIVK